MRTEYELNATECDGMRDHKSDFFGLFLASQIRPDFGL